MLLLFFLKSLRAGELLVHDHGKMMGSFVAACLYETSNSRRVTESSRWHASILSVERLYSVLTSEKFCLA